MGREQEDERSTSSERILLKTIVSEYNDTSEAHLERIGAVRLRRVARAAARVLQRNSDRGRRQRRPRGRRQRAELVARGRRLRIEILKRNRNIQRWALDRTSNHNEYIQMTTMSHRLVIIPDTGRGRGRARGLGVLADIHHPLLIRHGARAVVRVIGGRVLQRREVVCEARRRIGEAARRLLQLCHHTLSNRVCALAL